MKILYIILTGQVFAETRNVWAEDTWLKTIDTNDDYFFLAEKEDQSKKILGFDTEGGHQFAFFKLRGLYLDYNKNPQRYNDYDWFFFVDSDTYVRTKRTRKFLNDYSLIEDSPILFGRLNLLPNIENSKTGPGSFGGQSKNQIISYFENKVEYGPWYCHGGGAGWVLNKSGVKKISDYLTNCGEDFPWSQHYDLSHAMWVNDCDIPMVHSRLFRYETKEKYKNSCEYLDNDVITWHYMKEQDFYSAFTEDTENNIG